MQSIRHEILYTEDLAQFSLPPNRPIDPGRAASIAAEIKGGRNLLAAFPIVVDSRLGIVDGQHRWQGATLARVGIFYIVVPGLTFEDQAAAARLTKSWSLSDWAHTWAKHPTNKNAAQYQRLMSMAAEFPAVPLSTMIDYTRYGAWDRRLLKTQFMAGEYTIADEAAARTLASWHADFHGAGLPNGNALSGAVVRLYRNPDYDHAWMMGRMAEYPTQVNKCHDAEQYLAMFQDLYNWRRRSGQRVHLAAA